MRPSAFICQSGFCFQPVIFRQSTYLTQTMKTLFTFPVRDMSEFNGNRGRFCFSKYRACMCRAESTERLQQRMERGSMNSDGKRMRTHCCQTVIQQVERSEGCQRFRCDPGFTHFLLDGYVTGLHYLWNIRWNVLRTWRSHSHVVLVTERYHAVGFLLERLNANKYDQDTKSFSFKLTENNMKMKTCCFCP